MLTSWMFIISRRTFKHGGKPKEGGAEERVREVREEPVHISHLTIRATIIITWKSVNSTDNEVCLKRTFHR